MTGEGRRGLGSVAVALSGQATNSLVLALAAILLPRLLGPEEYGRFSAYMALVAMLLVVSALGLPFLEVRFLPPLRRAERRRDLADLSSTLFGVRLMAGVLAAAVCMFWSYLSGGRHAGVTIAVLVGLFALTRYAFASARSLLLPLARIRWYAALDVGMTVLFLGAFVIGYRRAGLEGGFTGAAVATLALFSIATAVVRAEVPLSPRSFRPSLLRPLFGHGLNAFVGSVATATRFGLPIWAVATWGGARAGGYFGVAMQVFGLVTGMVFAARQAVMPVLAELDDAGETDRVFLWMGWMLRSSLALVTTATMIWVLVGRDLTVLALGEPFAPVYWPVTWILIAVIATVVGGMANGLLYLRKHSRCAAQNLVAAAVLTVAGVALVLANRGDGVVARPLAADAAAAVAAAAILFMLMALLRISAIESRKLPLGRSAILALPLALLWPAAQWQGDLSQRVAIAGVFALLYLAGAVASGSLDREGLRYILYLALDRGASDIDASSEPAGVPDSETTPDSDRAI